MNPDQVRGFSTSKKKLLPIQLKKIHDEQRH